MTTRAVLGSRRMPMHDDSAAAVVMAEVEKRFVPGTVNVPDLIEKSCGRFARGKHAGKLRGWAEIVFVRSGGWYRGGGLGRVVRPGAVLSVTITDYNGKVYFSA